MPTPLLTTKLYIPPTRPELVPRPRLIERLNAELGRKLTLISAPAGFGKTTLLSAWINQYLISNRSTERSRQSTQLSSRACRGTLKIAWLSLDKGDNDLNRFLSYLVAALQTIESNVGQGLLGALQSPGAVNVEAVLTTLLNEIASIPDKHILILDDYHVIESQAIDKALTFLLDHLPPHMHLLIATRTDPSLALSRLRARGQLAELRAADLRFSSDEATAFFEQIVRLPLAPDDVQALEKRTEGWITGLQLAAVALQGLEGREQIAHFIHSFGGSHRYVIDYLVDEVLDQQTPQIQEFLLRTSILERLTAPLCNVVANREDSQAILEKLETANLFLIPLDGERRWYRYHHLFADLLRQRLEAPLSSPLGGGKEGGHTRASDWYAENGLEIDALHHAAAANDFERAARLVEGDGNPLYHRGAVTPVLHWLESLPASLLDTRPSLWVMYAEVLMTRGQLDSAKEKYQAAKAALQDAEQHAATRDLLGRIANGLASLASFQYQLENTISLSRRALNLLHPDNLAIRAAASLNLGYAYQLQGDRVAARRSFQKAAANGQAAGHVIVCMMATERLGSLQAAENRLHQAAQTFQRALQLAGEHPLPYAGESHLGLAQIFYQWNDLQAAQRHGQQSVQLARQIEHTDKSIPAEILLARLKLAQGDVIGAAAILDQASQSVQQHGFVCLPDVVAAQVLVLLRQGKLAAAAQLAQTHDLPTSQARVYLAQGEAAAALAILDPLRQQMEAQAWQDETLKVMVLQTLALYAQGTKDKAVQLLGDALALAEPGGLIRIFVDQGAPMAQLLRQAAARGIMPDYTNKLLAAFDKDHKSADAPPPSQPLVEPLSKRELQVLQLVAQGLSNREISERLFLALDTVKGHNRRIYAKLQVKNRTQAVNRARSLDILPLDN